jgi:hypothetical protein
LAGINYSDESSKTDWNLELKNYESPKTPYSAWLGDGRISLGEKVEDVRRKIKLKTDEAGGTELDGIALYISHPEILEDYSLYLPGTCAGLGFAVFLHLRIGRPELIRRSVSHADHRCGSVVCGKQK